MKKEKDKEVEREKDVMKEKNEEKERAVVYMYMSIEWVHLERKEGRAEKKRSPWSV